MARALARGWGEPVLCTDSGSGRAQALADELGGEALGSNAELARRADVVVLVPQARAARARSPREVAPAARRPSSRSSAASRVATLARRLPRHAGRPRAAQHAGRGRAGASSLLAEPAEDRARRRGRRAVRRVGHRRAPRRGAASTPRAACWAAGPRTGRCVAEAQVDAGVRRGMPRRARGGAGRDETMAGTAALLRARDHDTLAVRREVTSPGRHDRARAWPRSSAAACAPPSPTRRCDDVLGARLIGHAASDRRLRRRAGHSST